MGVPLPRFGWAVYDHLGGLLGVNLLWTALSLPWLVVGALVLAYGQSFQGGARMALASGLVAAQLVLVAPPAIVLHGAASRWSRGQEVELAVLWADFKRYFWRAQGLGATLVFVSAVLLGNGVFYFRWGGFWGLALAGCMVWLVGASMLVGWYLLPLLVTQDSGFLQTLKQAGLMAADNVLAGLGQGFWGVIALVLCFFSAVGLFAGGLAAWVLWQHLHLRRLLARYTGEPLASEPERSFSEVVRPWENS